MLSYLRFNFDRVLRPSIKKIYLDISVLIENITFPSMYFFVKYIALTLTLLGASPDSEKFILLFFCYRYSLKYHRWT